MKNKSRLVSVLVITAIIATGCGSGGTSDDSSVINTELLRDDFYTAVNEDAIKNAVIPDDKASVGTLDSLAPMIEEKLMSDFDDMIENGAPEGNGMLAEFIEYYELAIDIEGRDADGSSPIIPLVEELESIDNFYTMTASFAELLYKGHTVPFILDVSADMMNSEINTLYLDGLKNLLPDKSYYEEGDELGEKLLSEYNSAIHKLCLIFGKSEEESKRIADNTISYDRFTSKYMMTSEELSVFTSIYNPIEIDEYAATVKNMDITEIISQIIGQKPQEIVLSNLHFYEALDEIISEENFEMMRDWMIGKDLLNKSPYLSQEMRIIAETPKLTLKGIAEIEDAKLGAFHITEDFFQELIGHYYGDKYLGEESKKDVTKMIEEIIKVYRTRLEQNDWLSEETIQMAIRKLDSMKFSVGYPDNPPKRFETMSITTKKEGGTFLGNTLSVNSEFLQVLFSRYGQPVDPSEWGFGAHYVNAFYEPTQNSIYILAGILQDSIYSLDQHESANYGAIGIIIGHEISHAFDTNGASFDENGSLSDWWTAEDYTIFEERSQSMIDLFEGLKIEGVDDVFVNGKLTVSENIADLGGINSSLEAAMSLDGANAEEFFTSYARMWFSVMTPEAKRNRLLIDVHAPTILRVNTQLPNIDLFIETYGIQEGDGMFRPEGERVVIW